MRRQTKAAPAGIISEDGMPAARGRVVAALLFGLLLLGLAPQAIAATPTDTYGYLATFGGGASAEGPTSIGLDASNGGNIVVGQGPQILLRIFAPDPNVGGSEITTFTTSGAAPSTIAIDPVNGDVYAYDGCFFLDCALKRFNADGKNPSSYTLDPDFTGPGEVIGFGGAGLAVDPVTRDVLVARDGSVHRVSRTGAYLGSFPASGAAVAVGPTGTIYLANGGQVDRYAPDGTPATPLTLTAGSNASAVAVNQVDERVAVINTQQGQTFIDIFNPAGDFVVSSHLLSAAAGSPAGLVWDGALDRIYYLTGDASVHTLGPAVQPGFDTPVVEAFTRAGAHASSVVAPGGEETTARLEYCRADFACGNYPASDPNDPSNPWVRGPDHTGIDCVDPDTSCEVTVEDDLPLTPNRTWKVRVYASNARVDNTSATTTVVAPLAAPEVGTGAAVSVEEESAELLGAVSGYGSSTTYYFEYGTSDSYGSRVPVETGAPLASQFYAQDVDRYVAGLEPGTLYHYRLVATNSAGTTEGDDRTFNTRAIGETPQRVYEQVTPVDKGGASVGFANHFQVSDDGSKILVATTSGDAEESENAYIYNHFLSVRGADDWADWKPTDPPADTLKNGPTEGNTLAMSPDFTKALVVSNRVLAPGGEAGLGNLYLREMATDEYTFIASGDFFQFAGVQQLFKAFIDGADDFSWLLFQAKIPLQQFPGANPWAVYRWTEEGGLEIESRLPDGSIPTQPANSSDPSVATHLVSDDGTVTAFSIEGVGAFRRENGVTEGISFTPDDPGTLKPGFVYALSRDGRYAFLSVGNQLYRYDDEAETPSEAMEHIGNAPESSMFDGVSDSGDTVYWGDPPLATRVWRDGEVHKVIDGTYAFAGSSQVAYSPNGRYLLFLGDYRANLYDADEQTSVCVSCAPDGTPIGDARIHSEIKALGNQPYHAVTNDGEAFFDTTARLTSADTNNRRDVYSFKNGHATLISPGNADVSARYIDASPDGSSVFFTTSQGLVARDTDGEADVYVARVGGGLPKQNELAPPPCDGDDCQASTSTPPSVPSLGSSTSNGPGNQRKKAAKPKAKCSKKSKKNKGKKKNCKAKQRSARTAGTDRRESK